MSKFKMFAFTLLLVGSVSACAHTGRVSESEKSVDSIRGVANKLSLAQTEIDKVDTALDDLSTASNMQTAFKTYVKSVASIQAARQRTTVQRANMQKNSRQYIAKWQKELESIQDPDVKNALAERKEKVASSFEDIGSLMDDLREAYQPYFTNITEIRKALALDLNPSGVKALEPAINKAKIQSENVKEQITKVRLELEKIAGSMSPTVEIK